jgi:hypothetical protein
MFGTVKLVKEHSKLAISGDCKPCLTVAAGRDHDTTHDRDRLECSRTGGVVQSKVESAKQGYDTRCPTN